MTYRFAFDEGGSPSLMFSAEQALAFEPRSTLADAVRDRSGLELCGAGTACAGA